MFSSFPVPVFGLSISFVSPFLSFRITFPSFNRSSKFLSCYIVLYIDYMQISPLCYKVHTDCWSRTVLRFLQPAGPVLVGRLSAKYDVNMTQLGAGASTGLDNRSVLLSQCTKCFKHPQNRLACLCPCLCSHCEIVNRTVAQAHF